MCILSSLPPVRLKERDSLNILLLLCCKDSLNILTVIVPELVTFTTTKDFVEVS